MARFDLRLKDHIDDPGKKRLFNERMFSTLAPEYNIVTRMMSFGRDQSWKRELVSALPAVKEPACVDLGCGTGDVTFLLAGRYGDGRVLGVDIAEPMLAIARRRSTFGNVMFASGDIAKLDLPSDFVDIVTGGYVLRNAADLPSALAEVHRVLRPNGVAAFLDYSKPPGMLQNAELGLLKCWGGLWGLILHRNPELYTYIAESLRRFPDRAALREKACEAGFEVVSSRLFFLGVVELLVLRKGVSRPPRVAPI